MCPVAYRSRRYITFSGTVKNPFGRGAHEDRLLLLLRRAGLQEQDGRVPGGLAHARVRRRGPQGRLRRRHIPRQGPRRPHRAVAEVWPQTMVQRCLWHAFSQVNRHMTSRPRLRAGMLRGLDGVGAWFEGGRIWFCGAEKLGISFIREVTAFKRRITNKDSVILYHMEKTQQTHCTSCCVLRWFNSMRLEQT